MKFNFLNKTEFRVFLTIWIIYLYYMSNYGGSYMSDSMLHLTQAIVDDRSFITDKYLKEQCKKETGCDHAYYKSHYYSGFAPGASFLAVPVYFIFKPFYYFIPDYLFDYPKIQISTIITNIISTIFVSALLSALLAVLIFRLTRYLSNSIRNRLFVTFMFSFGTLFFLYSTSFDKHILATFFLFLSFYFLFNMKRKRINNKILFFSGLSASFAIAIDYPAILIVVIIFIYLISFLRDKRVLFFIFGALIPIVFVLIYHYIVFDNALTTPYAHRIGIKWEKEYSTGVFAMTLSQNWGKLWLISFSPYRGFFFFMPIMLLSFYGLFYALKNKVMYRREFYFIFAVFIVYFVYNFFLTSSTSPLNCSFGSRHMIPVLPFMIIPLIFVFEKIRFIYVFFFGLISFFINFLSMQYEQNALWTPGGCTDPNIIFNYYIPFLFNRGLSNYTFNLINKKLIYLSPLFINLVNLIFLSLIGIIIYLIWRKRV